PGGGNELQMAGAWRVAGARAELGQPEINLHVIPGFGGTQMLPRLAARRARVVGGQMYTLLVDALAILLDGRRRSAARAHAVGVVDEVAPADALSHALGVARRLVTGEFSGVLFSPLADGSTVAFPNVERDPEIARLLAHHAAVPRSAPAAAILEVVRVGLTEGLPAGLALEARRFGELTAGADGRDAAPPARGQVQVVFSRPPETADDVLRALAVRGGAGTVVASSDRAVRDAARRAGAVAVSAEDFAAALRATPGAAGADDDDDDDGGPVRRGGTPR